ncbi:hypothetical protein [Alicyclobacillus fastidiosus]|uniref:Uncharacterized protein n=1 Tax=Alicyclobacillus fastidiosus TaxID=392011 RepID=A0ABV5A9I1_9BACL|nr:hypothetical protein [Alicyclobacillus fastidiosus]WEH10859.1 hypothetical protein PYS47_06485 [Alicyclobacillus fastidiosus]
MRTVGLLPLVGRRRIRMLRIAERLAQMLPQSAPTKAPFQERGLRRKTNAYA